MDKGLKVFTQILCKRTLRSLENAVVMSIGTIPLFDYDSVNPLLRMKTLYIERLNIK